MYSVNWICAIIYSCTGPLVGNALTRGSFAVTLEAVRMDKDLKCLFKNVEVESKRQQNTQHAIRNMPHI